MSFWSPLLIKSTQLFDKFREALRRSKGCGRQNPAIPPAVEEIRHFCMAPPIRKALLSLSPAAWQRALKAAPNIECFNVDGLTYEMVRALNLKGYSVDIADLRAEDFRVQKHYELYLGHGGRVGKILQQLPPETFIMQYASGAYWKEFNRMSQQRYDDFGRRRGLPQQRQFVRSLAGTESGEEELARSARAAFNSGPRTVATFGEFASKVELLYLGCYLENDLVVRDRDFAIGRRNFIYMSGTSGNIQKGMDLLIEAFARMPDLHLYICCKVEEEVSRAYRRELSLPNIHYIYHQTLGPLRGRLRGLLRRINFTISAPIDTGPGTAFLGSMGLGLIPVGYVDIEAEESNSVLTPEYSVDALMKVARRASEQSIDWCRQASCETLERFARLHEPPAFGANFKAYLDRLGM